MAEVTYERSYGPGAATLLDGFLPAYEEVYVEAPYSEGPREVAEFIELFQRQALRPGFRLILARDDDEVVGFAFGYRLPADTSWWNGMLTPLPSQDFTRETGERTFTIIELAVRKPWRRRGIADALHTRLVDGLGVERVTLTMRPEPEAAPAQRAYEAWGYVKVGRTRPWDEAPVYDAMVLGLR
ncbi:GNAT family N-acetyltransferase [Streptomyces sp. NPDC037389]|uniref:GNAT family N-acetyltransferase n=1 Tax=Streptomyces sp. NPDC037389 TaxID=3155369 RepID=UPI0033E9FB2D